MKLRKLVMVSVMVLAMVGVANATILFEFDAANGDPLTQGQGWTLNTSGTTAGLVGGVEGGTAYWEIADTNTGLTQYANITGLGYATTRGSANGWTYTAKLRVVDCDPGQSGVIMRFLEGHHAWVIEISEAGVTIGSTTVATFDTTTAYHTYQLVGNPTDTTKVDVYIDGQLALGGYTQGYAYAGYGAQFGSGSTTGAGTGRYSYVSFENETNIVPEPATMLLLGVFGASALIRRRK